MKKLILFVPLMIFLGMGFFLYKGLFLNPKVLESALEGKPVPYFELEQLEQSDKVITNKDLIGKVAMLNVWGTWCPACKYEHPYLMVLARNKQIPIYGINYRDERDMALEELKLQGNPYEINIFDKDGRLGLDLGVYGAPESFLIDHQGIVRYRFAGPIDQRIWADTLYPIVKTLQEQAVKDGAS
ncbi:DsbE family thiol:disulfide interchange protein [Shewanella sp. SR44-3]|uniref:DsbE family thiol:disulfide interchange protein n=1 Tax=unclassified Shewanella TaxID=196818 RepID=UPI0015F8FE37|nr:DsbE family thiol:disulfide interchange protein [Shewanella sp. SR44-3]MBB1268708.1 DsbE family thiol:disulfide interchange protein [Shewanella sp. SR44-3]